MSVQLSARFGALACLGCRAQCKPPPKHRPGPADGGMGYPGAQHEAQQEPCKSVLAVPGPHAAAACTGSRLHPRDLLPAPPGHFRLFGFCRFAHGPKHEPARPPTSRGGGHGPSEGRAAPRAAAGTAVRQRKRRQRPAASCHCASAAPARRQGAGQGRLGRLRAAEEVGAPAAAGGGGCTAARRQDGRGGGGGQQVSWVAAWSAGAGMGRSEVQLHACGRCRECCTDILFWVAYGAGWAQLQQAAARAGTLQQLLGTHPSRAAAQAPKCRRHRLRNAQPAVAAAVVVMWRAAGMGTSVGASAAPPQQRRVRQAHYPCQHLQQQLPRTSHQP